MGIVYGPDCNGVEIDKCDSVAGEEITVDHELVEGIRPGLIKHAATTEAFCIEKEVNSLLTIREEQPEDIEAIRAVNQKAFGQAQECQLVDALRTNGGVLLSLVATRNGRVVGHILYSPVIVHSGLKAVIGAGLGPMAVLPEYQRQGIGGKLIESGNKNLLDSGCPFIVVLGHPNIPRILDSSPPVATA